MTTPTTYLPFADALARGLVRRTAPCRVRTAELAHAAAAVVDWEWRGGERDGERGGALRVHVTFARRAGVWSYAADRVEVAVGDETAIVSAGPASSSDTGRVA